LDWLLFKTLRFSIAAELLGGSIEDITDGERDGAAEALSILAAVALAPPSGENAPVAVWRVKILSRSHDLAVGNVETSCIVYIGPWKCFTSCPASAEQCLR
jgi:hypothetical protein